MTRHGRAGQTLGLAALLLTSIIRTVPTLGASFPVALIFAASACSGAGQSTPSTEAQGSTSGAHRVHPPISDDGWIAYQTSTNGSDRVYLVHADGSADHEIAQGLPGRVAHPDFSRDGSQLVFDQLTSESATDQIYIANADGSRIRHIAPCRAPECLQRWEGSWSPDGARLAVSTADGPLTDTGPSRFGIAIIDVASGRVVQLVDHPSKDGQDHSARWSPDGRRLVFWRERARSDGSVESAIFAVSSKGAGLQRLTPWSMLAADPDWSPDGSLIVFGTRPLLDFAARGESELYTMRPDGSEKHALTTYGTDGPRATQPRWTPDGKAVLYTRLGQTVLPRHIWLLNADGSADRPVLESKSIYTHPVLQPG